MEITSSLVKQLRDRTGAGMMECKNALVSADGDIEKAIENLRKKERQLLRSALIELQIRD